jgi:hypothetical protein
MEVRWFGEPWPSELLRAPVCEDDARRIETPVGQICIECLEPIGKEDQGVVMLGIGIEQRFEIILGARRHEVCAEHLECFLLGVLGKR